MNTEQPILQQAESVTTRTEEHSVGCSNARHWLEYATVIFAGLAFVTACFAAGFAWYQGWVARDTEKRQVRAYAFSTPTGIQNFETGKEPSAQITVRTMGETPAYNVHGRITVEGLSYPLPASKDLHAYPSTSQVGNSAFLSPSNTFSLTASSPDRLNQATIDAINDGNTFRIYVYGRVDYEDVFRDPHWFTYCYAYAGADIEEHRSVETCLRYNDDDHH